MNYRILSFAVAVGIFSAPVVAEPVSEETVQRVQGEMMNRVSEAAARYARQISLDQTYVSYCNGELYLKTYQHPANGYIPFGVNYNEIRDSERLSLVLSSREAYEKSYLILCLANAKNALREAARP